MLERLSKLFEKITGKHIHAFSRESPIVYFDGTKVYHCRCGAIAIIKR